MTLIKPQLKDDLFLKDIRNAESDLGSFHLWWLGQSGFLVQWKRRHLLLDPYLSDSLTEKYAATDKPHIRMTELIVDPARLDFIDVALLPINGRAPERRVAGNLNAKEAASLARQIGAKIVIPHHYEMFTFNTADANEFAQAARATGQRYAVLKCGQRWSSDILEQRF